MSVRGAVREVVVGAASIVCGIIDVMLDRGRVVYGLLQQVRPLVLDSARVVECRISGLGWTVGSRAVVEVLADGEPATVPTIAARLSLARQNIQRHVDVLVRLGHAATVVNPAHRRSVLVALTDAGRVLFDRVHADELAELTALAPEVSGTELAAATRVLEALRRDIAARSGHTEGDR